MEEPTFQSDLAVVPKRYCVMSAGLVTASQTLAAEALIAMLAVALNASFLPSMSRRYSRGAAKDNRPGRGARETRGETGQAVFRSFPIRVWTA
jgi:hypothetical protein